MYGFFVRTIANSIGVAFLNGMCKGRNPTEDRGEQAPYPGSLSLVADLL